MLEWLAPAPNQIVVDGTVGAGGHAAAILERLEPHGRLIGFDRDPQALSEARKSLVSFGDRAMLVQENFKNIARKLKEIETPAVQGVLLDLGVSSMQLDRPERGFSFKVDGPLDMRMNPENPLTAREIIRHYPKKELQDILWNFGQERFAKKIAERITQERSKRSIDTTMELASIIFQAVPKSYRYGRIHPATRSFQALRLVVNQELESLRECLAQVLDSLDFGGRLVVISFHSLEDRIVKVAFKEFQKEKQGRVLTKKPVVPTEAEISQNARARSAKLRAFEKLKEA